MLLVKIWAEIWVTYSDSVTCGSVKPDRVGWKEITSGCSSGVMSGRFVFTNQEKSWFLLIHMFFSNLEKLWPRMHVTPKCCSCIMLEQLDLPVQNRIFWRITARCECTHWQHKVSACCNSMNRKIPLPTSHNEINCEVLSNIFFVVVAVVWVEVWKGFSHVSVCFVGGCWIWFLRFEVSSLVGRDEFFLWL